MKQTLILLCVLLCGAIGTLHATDCQQQQKRLSREEFRVRQQAYITEKAELTADEAVRFFPVYFELQDKKKQLNDAAWKLFREGKGKDGEVSEKRYEEILETVHDSRIECSRLDKSYLTKFRKILSNKKIYQVQQAEMRFHRELVKGMRHPKGHKR